MSMALYALFLHPFLRLLDLKLPITRIGRRTRPTSVGLPDGKHIKQLAGAKMLGIFWRYYNLRRTSTGETVFHLAAG